MQFVKLLPEDNPPTLPPGEEAYKITLDNASHVYAACWIERDRDAAANMFGVVAVARAMEANGAPILDDDLKMVFGKGPASVLATQLIVGGIVNESLRQQMFENALAAAINAMLAARSMTTIPLDVGLIASGTLSLGGST